MHRIGLLHLGSHDASIEQMSADIRSVSLETRVNPVKLATDDPWGFEQVYGALHDFARDASESNRARTSPTPCR